MNAAAKRHRLTCTRRREYIRRLGKAASGLPLRQCGQWSQRAHEHTSTRAHEHTSTRAHEHTSTRAHEHTSTRAHEHTSTRYPTYPAAERPDHTRQYLPCRSTEIRHQHTPRCASLPRRPAENASPHTATQAPTVGSIIPAARTEARRTQHAAAQKTPRHEPARPNRRPLHPKNPMSPACHRGGLHFEQAHGGFCNHRPPTRRRHAAKQRLW